jgi:ACS family tartrate transporter-like MFS transporter
VCGLFILSFLDRVNVSFAGLDMTRDLAFGPKVYGLGSGLFFIGYLILEVPITALLTRGSARFWLAMMMIAWGFAAAAMGTIHSVKGFYTYRVLLGIAEAGFFPGIIIYLSRWFPKRDRARAIGALAVGLPAANLLGAPLSAALLSHHWLQIPGWRWLFVMEGLPSVIAGLFALRYLADGPRDATWLSRDEVRWLEDTLKVERKNEASRDRRFLFSGALLVFSLVWFLDNMGVYGFNFWLPMIVKKFSSFSSAAVALISATPFFGALIASAFVSLSSDRSGERRWHAAIPMVVFATGLTLSVLSINHPLLALGALCFGALGLTSGTPSFWALVTGVDAISGSTAIAVITSAGALGGFCGPYVMGALRAATNQFYLGLAVLAGAVFASSLILIAYGAKIKIEDR